MNCTKCNHEIEDNEHHAVLSYQHEIGVAEPAVTDAEVVARWCKRCAPSPSEVRSAVGVTTPKEET